VNRDITERFEKWVSWWSPFGGLLAFAVVPIAFWLGGHDPDVAQDPVFRVFMSVLCGFWSVVIQVAFFVFIACVVSAFRRVRGR